MAMSAHSHSHSDSTIAPLSHPSHSPKRALYHSAFRSPAPVPIPFTPAVATATATAPHTPANSHETASSSASHLRLTVPSSSLSPSPVHSSSFVSCVSTPLSSALVSSFSLDSPDRSHGLTNAQPDSSPIPLHLFKGGSGSVDSPSDASFSLSSSGPLFTPAQSRSRPLTASHSCDQIASLRAAATPQTAAPLRSSVSPSSSFGLVSSSSHSLSHAIALHSQRARKSPILSSFVHSDGAVPAFSLSHASAALPSPPVFSVPASVSSPSDIPTSAHSHHHRYRSWDAPAASPLVAPDFSHFDRSIQLSSSPSLHSTPRVPATPTPSKRRRALDSSEPITLWVWSGFMPFLSSSSALPSSKRNSCVVGPVLLDPCSARSSVSALSLSTSSSGSAPASPNFSPASRCESASASAHAMPIPIPLNLDDGVPSTPLAAGRSISPAVAMRSVDDIHGSPLVHASVQQFSSVRLRSADFHWDTLLNTGSFGELWQVRFRDKTDSFALKRAISPFQSARSRDREVDRVLLLQSVQPDLTPHPNVLLHYAAWLEGGKMFLLSEVLSGDLKNAPVSSELELWRLLSDISCALHYLHGKGILHFDVKCANVMRGKQGFKLIDFGSAIRIGEWKAGDEEGDGVYLAPEVLNGGPVGPAVDVYGLGASAFELATGLLPNRRMASEAAMSDEGDRVNQRALKNVELFAMDDSDVSTTDPDSSLLDSDSDPLVDFSICNAPPRFPLSDRLMSLILLMTDRNPSKRPNARIIQQIATAQLNLAQPGQSFS